MRRFLSLCPDEVQRRYAKLVIRGLIAHAQNPYDLLDSMVKDPRDRDSPDYVAATFRRHATPQH